MLTKGQLVTIGQDAGIVSQVYVSDTGNLVELRMVKNAFGQGAKEIIPQETAEGLIRQASEQDLSIDIGRRFQMILHRLQATLPVSKEELQAISRKAIEEWYAQDQE